MGKPNRELVLRALTDATFRKQLEADPEKALGKSGLTETQKQEIRLVIASVKGIENHIHGLADQLLCVNGGCRGVGVA